MRVALLVGGGALAYLWVAVDPSPLSIGVGLISTVLIAVGLTADELALKGRPREEWIGGFRVERSGRRPTGWSGGPELVIRVVGPSGHTAEMTGVPFLGRERDVVASWDHQQYVLEFRDGHHRLIENGGAPTVRISAGPSGGFTVEGLNSSWHFERNPRSVIDSPAPDRVQVLVLAYILSERVELIS